MSSKLFFLCSSLPFSKNICKEINFLFKVLEALPEDRPHAVLSWLVYRYKKDFCLEWGSDRSVFLSENVPLRQEEQNFGNVDVIYEKKHVGVYVLRIAPGSSIPMHYHNTMRENELILGSGLKQSGKKVEIYSAWSWPLGQVHSYENPTADYQEILCIDQPSFQPEDEIIV